METAAIFTAVFLDLSCTVIGYGMLWLNCYYEIVHILSHVRLLQIQLYG